MQRFLTIVRWTAPLISLMLAGEALAHVPSASGSSLLSSWNDDPWLVVPLIVSAALYMLGWRRLSHRAAPRASRRTAFAFWAGWLTLVLALASPLDAMGGQLFSVHMIQHEALMLVAAPLLVLGKPLAVGAWALPRHWVRKLARPARKPAWRRSWRWLTLPRVAWSVHAAILWLWHMPAWFSAALVSEAIHTLQHAGFLGSALLFWWALLRRPYGTAPVLYVFTTLLHTGVLGMLLTFAPAAWYPPYLDTTARWGLTPLEDQQLGGLVMWVPAGAILLVIGLALLVRSLDRLSRPDPWPRRGIRES